ncbi:hypothetical protein B0H19DRAFT_1214065 [Mycena capillaripes]|nr:hypothetical protein B0H19DRAFT_1214065 [Mycena capillaripes]
MRSSLKGRKSRLRPPQPRRIDWLKNTFKGLDNGREEHPLSKAVWETIAAETASASDTIPSVYGSRVPNIAKDRPNVSAEMWSFWTLYLGPVLLRPRFKDVKYYRHFIRLVRLLNLCLKFEITDNEIDLYFQKDVSRMSVCPLTVHALLHIAAGIKFCGPVWCYWAFPMERYCGRQPGIRSRRFPWASIDRYVLEIAQLTQIQTLYNVIHRAALSTRTGATMSQVNAALRTAVIEEWGKVCRIDSEAGNTMRSCSLGTSAEDSRDSTYVRYQLLVDKNARHKNKPATFELTTFYGQLTHIYRVHIPTACPPLHQSNSSSHFYSAQESLDVVDIPTVQSLVGRVKRSGNAWAIIDRSEVLARAEWLGEEAD